MYRRTIRFLTAMALVFALGLPAGYSAEPVTVTLLPVPGTMASLSAGFQPPVLTGIRVNPRQPLEFEFILDSGLPITENLSPERQEQFKQESRKLLKYFLASLTIPDQDLWVNLSPYEKDRIIPTGFGQTQMGRDLLAQDYFLKQLTASLIYPEGETGAKFWAKVYQEAAARYGSTQVPIGTFNKVWVVPSKAVVYENGPAGTAYVVESKLKVMLEEDYLSLAKHSQAALSPDTAPTVNDSHSMASQIVRDIVIPALNREVNSGKNFAPLRQVYNSLILAAWYKKKIKDSVLTRVYSNQNKTAGIDHADPNAVQEIYGQYLKAFKKGAYNYIKEDFDQTTQETIPRKYFSGGMEFEKIGDVLDFSMRAEPSVIKDALKKSLIVVLMALQLPTLTASGPYQIQRSVESFNPARVKAIKKGLMDRWPAQRVAKLVKMVDDARLMEKPEAFVNTIVDIRQALLEVIQDINPASTDIVGLVEHGHLKVFREMQKISPQAFKAAMDVFEAHVQSHNFQWDPNLINLLEFPGGDRMAEIAVKRDPTGVYQRPPDASVVRSAKLTPAVEGINKALSILDDIRRLSIKFESPELIAVMLEGFTRPQSDMLSMDLLKAQQRFGRINSSRDFVGYLEDLKATNPNYLGDVSIERESRRFYVKIGHNINEMHEIEDPRVRYRDLEGLSARGLYSLIVSMVENNRDLLFHSAIKYVMERLVEQIKQQRISGARLLDRNYKAFLEQVIEHHLLGDFLSTMSEPEQIQWFGKFFVGLDADIDPDTKRVLDPLRQASLAAGLMKSFSPAVRAGIGTVVQKERERVYAKFVSDQSRRDADLNANNRRAAINAGIIAGMFQPAGGADQQFLLRDQDVVRNIAGSDGVVEIFINFPVDVIDVNNKTMESQKTFDILMRELKSRADMKVTEYPNYVQAVTVSSPYKLNPVKIIFNRPSKEKEAFAELQPKWDQRPPDVYSLAGHSFSSDIQVDPANRIGRIPRVKIIIPRFCGSGKFLKALKVQVPGAKVLVNWDIGKTSENNRQLLSFADAAGKNRDIKLSAFQQEYRISPNVLFPHQDYSQAFLDTALYLYQLPSVLPIPDLKVSAADGAMVGAGKPVNKPVSRTGGIDLNNSLMDLDVEDNGQGSIALDAADPAMLARLKDSPGLEPVVKSLKPLADLQGFLSGQ